MIGTETGKSRETSPGDVIQIHSGGVVFISRQEAAKETARELKAERNRIAGILLLHARRFPDEPLVAAALRAMADTVEKLP